MFVSNLTIKYTSLISLRVRDIKFRCELTTLAEQQHPNYELPVLQIHDTTNCLTKLCMNKIHLPYTVHYGWRIRLRRM